MHFSNWFLSALTLLAMGDGSSLAPQAQQSRPDVAAMLVPSEELRQPIFFAVLEGLYRDGVSSEIVDKLLEIDPITKYPANFVWSCPICFPVIDALDVYRARPNFRGRKTVGDTFGEGLPLAITEQIMHGEVLVRQQVIKTLVEGWIRVALDARRLTPQERQRFQDLMVVGRKQGMEYLENYRKLGGNYGWMKECPSCEAGNGACKSK